MHNRKWSHEDLPEKGCFLKIPGNTQKKHLRSIPFIKPKRRKPSFLRRKVTLWQLFSCEFCEIYQKRMFLWTPVNDNCYILLYFRYLFTSFNNKTDKNDNIHCEKYRSFHPISWCAKFVERHSFRIISGDSTETMRKLCLSTKFPHQETRWQLRYFSQWSISSIIQRFSEKLPEI